MCEAAPNIPPETFATTPDAKEKNLEVWSSSINVYIFPEPEVYDAPVGELPVGKVALAKCVHVARWASEVDVENHSSVFIKHEGLEGYAPIYYQAGSKGDPTRVFQYSLNEFTERLRECAVPTSPSDL